MIRTHLWFWIYKMAVRIECRARRGYGLANVDYDTALRVRGLTNGDASKR